jgi:hypothetical protein
MALALDELPLAQLDRAWERAGIISNDSKAADLVSEGRVLGVELRNGTKLQARGEKVNAILSAFCDLAGHPVCSPLSLAAFIGQLQWQCMLARPLFSCFDTVYSFVRLQPESIDQPLHDGVLSELALCCSLFGLWAADLTRPWLPLMVATDASGSHGFGMSVAGCSPELCRDVAACAGEGDMVARLMCLPGDPPELARKGVEYRLPLSMDDFRDVFLSRPSTRHTLAL